MLKEFSHFDPGVIQIIEYVARTSESIPVETSELNHDHESWGVIKVDSEVNQGGMHQFDFLI